MTLFDNRKSKYILLFVRNFQMNLEASGMIAVSANIQYLFMLLHGEALSQLYILSVEVGSITTAHLNCTILVLGK